MFHFFEVRFSRKCVWKKKIPQICSPQWQETQEYEWNEDVGISFSIKSSIARDSIGFTFEFMPKSILKQEGVLGRVILKLSH